jgi:hypothetical protein
MKRIKAMKAGTIVHVETPLGIVNIRVGLSDAKGRAVDAVEIIPCNYVGEKMVIRKGSRLIQTSRKVK